MPADRSRRDFTRRAAGLLFAGCLPLPALAADVRGLGFRHLHTGEKLKVVYFEAGQYLEDALAAINHLLRDHRSGDVHEMDPKLLDQLCALAQRCGRSGPFEVISGYRSPATNDMLRRNGSGVAKRSLHMQGRAIDVRLAGVRTNQLRRAATDLGRGGVGYYPKSDFVHLDTGRFRTW